MEEKATHGIKKNRRIIAGPLAIIAICVFLSACGGNTRQKNPERNLKATTETLIAQAATDEEKLERLFLYVRDEIAFNWAYPQDIPPEGVLKNGFGVCMQKANLLSAMARQAGFQTRFRFIYVRKQALEDFLPAYAYKNWSDPFPHTVVEILHQGRWRSFDPSFDGKLYKICRDKNINFARYPEIVQAYRQSFSPNGMKGTQEFWHVAGQPFFYGETLEPLMNWEGQNVFFLKRWMKPIIFRQARAIMDEFRK
jgi:hypothetical protein